MSSFEAGLGGRAGGRSGESARLRADLRIHPRERSGRLQYWLAHPISGRVVRLAGHDFRCLSDAAGRSGSGDPALLGEASAAGLIAGVRPSTANVSRSSWWRNPLYIRLPGIPADGVASCSASRTSWLFSASAVIAWLVMIGCVAAALLAQGPSILRALDPLVTFQAKHWGLVLATLALTKLIHELAHAAVCRRMGAAVREIGMLLLCGTPCLYCDVTDSWRVDSRLQRAAIMLAGVYVELILAALAGLIWLLSDDGLLRMGALNLICVCGVSTVLFNLNPLMRYDGYFVLSDILDVPNLRSRAADAWRTTVVRPLAGPAYEPQASGAAGVGGSALAAYHAASTVYRYVVLSALAGWAYLVLSRGGLEPFARIAVVAAVVAVIAGEGRKLCRVIAGSGGWRGVARWRRWGLAGGSIAAAGLLLFVPVERRVAARGVVHLHAAANVYTPRSGRVESVAYEFGSEVAAGAKLAQIEEPAMQVERLRLESQLEQLRIRRASLMRRALAHPELLEQLEQQSAAISATESQLQAVEAAFAQMTLTAPRGGTLLPSLASGSGGDVESGSRGGSESSTADSSAAWNARSPANNSFSASWSVPRTYPTAGPSSAVERTEPQLFARCGQTVEAGTIWCCIGDEGRKKVILEVDAARRHFVRVGRQVRIQLDQSPAQIVACEVLDVSAMRHDRRGFAEFVPRDRFTVACLLPEEVALDARIGGTATGIIRGEPLRLWDWCVRSITGSGF